MMLHNSINSVINKYERLANSLEKELKPNITLYNIYTATDIDIAYIIAYREMCHDIKEILERFKDVP